MKALVKIFSSGFKSFIRDRGALFWTLALPVMLIVIFGLVFSNPGAINFDIGLVAESPSPFAQGLRKAFQAVPVLTVHEGDRETELKALDRARRDAVIILPKGAADFLPKDAAEIPPKNREPVSPIPVEVYYDQSKFSSAQAVLSVVEKVFSVMENRMTGRTNLFLLQQKPIAVRHLRYIDYLLPGILAAALMQLGIFASVSLIVEKEKGILRRLGVTPLRRPIWIMGNGILRLVIAFIQTFIILGLGWLLFGVRMLGSYFVLLGLVVLGATTFTAIGYAIASFARTQEAGMAVAQSCNFLFMFLSGIFWPLGMMPKFLQPIIKAIPLTYLGDALRQIMTKSSAVHPLSVDVLVLAGWLVAGTVVSFFFFRWE